MLLGPKPIRFQFKVQYQYFDGWREFVQCSDFDRSVQIADAVAEYECCMVRIVDVLHDCIIVHERVGPQPEFIDDGWDEEELDSEQVNWSKDGF